MFVFTQTVRHRDFFLPVDTTGDDGPVDADGDGHADPPTQREALTSLGLLVVALVAVVGSDQGGLRHDRGRACTPWASRTPSSAW